MAPGDLQEVLAVLKPAGTPPADLLVGLDAADDAAVYRLAPDLAIVETVDFFPPVVDDPWTWGVIAGGHTVVDAEPKYGLCVTGRVHPDRILIKGGLRPGDRVFLSKPLGTGVITTAAKNGVAPSAVLAAAVASMLRLNRVAARVARESGAKGATDITGFGFLGHAGEMVRASRAGLALDASRLPILPGTRELAEAGQFSGGMKRNRRHVDSIFGADLSIDPSVPGYLASLLTESETSGGLLFSVAPDRAGTVLDAFRRQGEECWEIGSVLAEPVIRVRA